MKKEDCEWDAFIVYVSEDKDEVVLPLYDKLLNNGMLVEIDQYELVDGDNLKQKIDEGLAKSRFGIAIATEQFFQKKWSKEALEALTWNEEEEKLIVPVWHGMDREQIANYDSFLPDKLPIWMGEGLDIVVKCILIELYYFFDDDNFILSSTSAFKLKEAVIYSKPILRTAQNYETFNRVLEKLESMSKKEENNNLEDYTLMELLTIMSCIDEYAAFIGNYKFGMFSEEDNIVYKRDSILRPLYELRARVCKAMPPLD